MMRAVFRFVFTVLDWAEYLPRGFRKAWCEITGGHDNEVLGSYFADGQANHIRLHCLRCGRETRWYPVPRRPTPNQEGGDHGSPQGGST